MSEAAVTLDPRVEAYLHDRHGARAAAIAVLPVSGDASTRRYFRLRDGAATSVLALHPEPFDPATSPFVVVRELLAGYGLPVPAILDHDGPRGVLLLADLGDLTLQHRLGTATPREQQDLYRQTLDHLVTLQRQAARGPKTAPCFQVAFDIEKLSWELHYFLKHFVEGLRRRDLTVEDRATLSEAFHRLSAEIASWPRVLCHRDFHSRNLMLHQGALHWIDFQDARMGPATYDLVSLLRDSYVELPEDLVSDQMEEFRQKASPGEARQVFARRFDLMAVQRNLKALGTFGYMTTVRGSEVYLQYIPRTLAHARRTLVRYPELCGLRRVLAHHIEELG